MIALRTLLIGLLVVLVGYTSIVIANHGLGLLPIAVGDMVSFNWPGQFDLDFLVMLMLSALWVAWRHQFSASGMLLALLALLGGSLFLTPYLCILSWQTHGNIQQMLIGQAATQDAP